MLGARITLFTGLPDSNFHLLLLSAAVRKKQRYPTTVRDLRVALEAFVVGLSPNRSILHDESRSCDKESCCGRPKRTVSWSSRVTTRLLHSRREAVLDHHALNQHSL